jgi:hypothetical protein
MNAKTLKLIATFTNSAYFRKREARKAKKKQAKREREIVKVAVFEIVEACRERASHGYYFLPTNKRFVTLSERNMTAYALRQKGYKVEINNACNDNAYFITKVEW